MKQQISFQQYRSIDLGLLGIFMAVSQLLIQFAVSKWFPGQLYVVSPVATVVALVMMRWGPWAAIHAVVGGVLFAVLAGGGMDHILIYGAGNLLSLVALLMFKVYDKERVRQSALLTILFALCVQLLMQLGRALLALAMGNPANICIGFITTDSLSDLFTVLVIWVARRVEGLFEDQKHYLLRLECERQDEGREQF